MSEFNSGFELVFDTQSEPEEEELRLVLAPYENPLIWWLILLSLPVKVVRPLTWTCTPGLRGHLCTGWDPGTRLVVVSSLCWC